MEEKKRNLGGRPRKEVEWREFDKLCSLQCTEQEIADWFEMNTDTLETRIREKYNCRFSELYRQKRGRGKIALRRMQMQSAEKGNVVMQIFLGKQYLNQKDKFEDQTETQPIKIEFVDAKNTSSETSEEISSK